MAQFIKDDDPTDILQFRFMDQHGKITKESIKWAFKPPYPPKYYINGTLSIIFLTIFLLWNYGVIPSNKLGFFCNDPLFSHKYRGDTVTPVMLGIGIASILPVIYLVIENSRQDSFKDIFCLAVLFEHYVFFKQFCIGLILVGGVTELAKTIVGEHRPHFFDTCMPDTNMNCTNGTYISYFSCTNENFTNLDKIDASRSFPSGHSSLSWFVGLFCSYLVHSRLPIHKAGTAYKLCLFAICLSFSLTCSLTRITDRRHHWWDVLIGTIIGALGAAYCIRATQRQVNALRQKIVSEEKEESQQIDCDV